MSGKLSRCKEIIGVLARVAVLGMLASLDARVHLQLTSNNRANLLEDACKESLGIEELN
jgi:hypothetical protein